MSSTICSNSYMAMENAQVLCLTSHPDGLPAQVHQGKSGHQHVMVSMAARPPAPRSTATPSNDGGGRSSGAVLM